MTEKKFKVLVVDDEPDFLVLLSVRLETAGYEVVTAPGGEEALQKLEQLEPDAVLLDIVMPGANGLSILKTIREKDKNLPIFMLTAFPDQERFKQARSLGASGFIYKATDLTQGLRDIASALRLASKFRENPS